MEWDPACGLTPTEWVVSKNLRRRNLTVAQRAALALALLPLLEAEAGERQGTRTDLGHSPDSGRKFGKASEKAADAVGVGRSTVEAAKAIAQRDPEVIEKMRRGELNVSQAARAVAMTGNGMDAPIKEADESSDEQVRAPVRLDVGHRLVPSV